jgi:tetratricopeptide (TPR) repeat protein
VSKPKYELTSAFISTSAYLSLGILTVLMTLPVYFFNTAQALAQFSDTGASQRSLLIQEVNSLFREGKLASAEEKLRQFIKKYPRDTFGHYQLGNVLLRQQKPEEAIKSYQEAIRLNSKYALAHNGIGVAFASQERWDEAIAEYQKALAINPNYGDALIYLGEALWQKGNRDEAVASFEKALGVYKNQNRPDKAQRVEEILRQLKSTDDPSLS